MADQQPTSVQAQVRSQFDRQVVHYLQGSAMADRQRICRKFLFVIFVDAVSD